MFFLPALGRLRVLRGLASYRCVFCSVLLSNVGCFDRV